MSEALVSLGPIHNSHLTAIRRCKRKFRYAFIEGIQPKMPALPLARGIWLHYCLEAQFLRWGIDDGTLLKVPEYTNVDGVGKVTITHGGKAEPLLIVDLKEDNSEFVTYPLSAKGMLQLLTEHVWNRLFDAEKEKYTEDGHGLPDACERILKEYFYFWKDYFQNREFEILLVEADWNREFEGREREGRIDYVLRNKRGQIVVGDWKSTKREPHPEYKFMESQLHLYAWGVKPTLEELGVTAKELKGVIVEFDYLSTKLPTIPSLNKDGSVSKKKINTTYLTLVEFLKDNDITWWKPQDIEEFLAKNEKEFFQRKTLPRSERVIDTLLNEDLADIEVIETIVTEPEKASRSVKYDCSFDCDFLPLCMGELYGQDVRYLRKSDYEARSNSHAGVVTQDD